MERARVLLIAAAAASGLLVGGTSVAADSLVFVLDGSGSMWGRVGGRIKIVEAKEVMADLLADVPPGVDVGLVAYGHRRTGDCADIETLVGFGTPAATVAERVQKVTPLGKTPITDSLRRGVDLLSGREGTRTLVLVSDGIETCGGDPCAVAEKLRAEGIELVIHTVGFDVGDDAQRQLQCVAAKGGGNYYHADSPQALRQALFAVRDATVRREAPPPPPEPPVLPEVKTTTERVVIAGPGTIMLKPAPWVRMPPYGGTVADAETGEQKGSSSSDRLRVKPGEYRIVWRQSQSYHTDIPLTEVVSVASRQTVEVPIDTGLRLTVPEGIAPPYKWSLRPLYAPLEEHPRQRRLDPSRGDGAVYRQTLDAQVAPAGTYRLLWWQDESLSGTIDLGPVTIEPGELNERVLDTGIVVRGADWLVGEPYRHALVRYGSDGSKTLQGLWKRFGAQLVPPGAYLFSYRHAESAYPQDLGWAAVEIPEHGFVTVTVDSGVRFVTAPETPLPYQVIFVPLDGAEKAEIVWKARFTGSWDPVPVPPGRYRLDWWEDEHATERMTLAEELMVPEGTLVEVEL